MEKAQRFALPETELPSIPQISSGLPRLSSLPRISQPELPRVSSLPRAPSSDDLFFPQGEILSRKEPVARREQSRRLSRPYEEDFMQLSRPSGDKFAKTLRPYEKEFMQPSRPYDDKFSKSLRPYEEEFMQPSRPYEEMFTRRSPSSYEDEFMGPSSPYDKRFTEPVRRPRLVPPQASPYIPPSKEQISEIVDLLRTHHPKIYEDLIAASGIVEELQINHPEIYQSLRNKIYEY